jgi:glutaminyl-peptide cyclotransferase
MHWSVVLVAILSAVSWAAADADPLPLLEWEVVSRRQHDSGAFTQGLVLDDAGRLYESTGRWGASTLREVDAASGEVLRSLALPEAWFGEGLALVDDDLIQLTWKAGLALRLDAATFELRDLYRYDGEGWGLCYDGERLVMSDGSSRLTFREPETFEPVGSVEVTLAGQPIDDLNELECVDGAIWANVWKTDAILRIDPLDGVVTGLLDLRGLLDPHPAASDPDAVLNGIASDRSADTLLVTGKYWPELIELRLLEPET